MGTAKTQKTATENIERASLRASTEFIANSWFFRVPYSFATIRRTVFSGCESNRSVGSIPAFELPTYRSFSKFPAAQGIAIRRSRGVETVMLG